MREEYIDEVARVCGRIVDQLVELDDMVRRMEGEADEAASSGYFSENEERTFEEASEVAAILKSSIGEAGYSLQSVVAQLRKIDS